MLDVSGVGDKKFEKYGNEFIEYISNYMYENNINQKYEFKENSKVEVEKDKLKTHEKTMNLLKEGMSIKEVANERELTISTIISHISKCISEGNLIDLDINFDELFTKEEEKLILEAADKVGMEKIGPIKSLLPNEITYDKINAVILNKKRCLMI